MRPRRREGRCNMSARQKRIDSVLQREISTYIINEGLEGLTGLLTITEVQATANLKHAKVFFSVIGQDEKQVSGILQKKVYKIQKMLKLRLNIKIVPRIAFVHDTSVAHAQRIGKLIQDMHDDPGK